MINYYLFNFYYILNKKELLICNKLINSSNDMFTVINTVII